MSKFPVLLFLIGVTSFAQEKMDASEAATLRTKVKSLAETTETISSDFVQYKHLDFLSNDIQSSGKLYFKSPNQVKWAYVDPFAYAVIFKENTMYVNNEGKKNQVDIGANKLFGQLNKLIRASVTGDLFDTDEFDISYFKSGANREVRFMPKDDTFSQYVQEFHIIFNNQAEVIAVKMIEPSQDFTHIVFSNRKTNEDLPDAVFVH
ncbi:MAG: outer membrane lipoprotein carrier protein LolA [Bacteroidota bacterium]